MSAASDYAATRELRRRKPIQIKKKKMLFDLHCTNLGCCNSYMIELEPESDYPETKKCPKCGAKMNVERLR